MYYSNSGLPSSVFGLPSSVFGLRTSDSRLIKEINNLFKIKQI